MNLRETLWTMGASLVTGLVLGLFAVVQSPFNAIMSLVGVGVVIMYFRKFDRTRLRVTFVIFSILYYALCLITIAAYTVILSQA